VPPLQAVVFMLALSVTGLSFIRRRCVPIFSLSLHPHLCHSASSRSSSSSPPNPRADSRSSLSCSGYQAFLALHVVGAGVILAGCWYHRPSMQDWVMATVGIWAFERLWRVSSVFKSWVNMRLVVRAPIMSARASVVDGAIKLVVPFKGAWGPGQHFYVSFWYVLPFCAAAAARPASTLRSKTVRWTC